METNCIQFGYTEVLREIDKQLKIQRKTEKHERLGSFKAWKKYDYRIYNYTNRCSCLIRSDNTMAMPVVRSIVLPVPPGGKNFYTFHIYYFILYIYF